MKLYEVRVSYIAYVRAKDEARAEDPILGITAHEPPTVEVREVTGGAPDGGWEPGSLTYGDSTALRNVWPGGLAE